MVFIQTVYYAQGFRNIINLICYKLYLYASTRRYAVVDIQHDFAIKKHRASGTCEQIAQGLFFKLDNQIR